MRALPPVLPITVKRATLSPGSSPFRYGMADSSLDQRQSSQHSYFRRVGDESGKVSDRTKGSIIKTENQGMREGKPSPGLDQQLDWLLEYIYVKSIQVGMSQWLPVCLAQPVAGIRPFNQSSPGM
jgi:hypothetical protein